MSWSFNGTGRPEEVLEKATKALKQFKCLEPEESIKELVTEILDVSLTNYPVDRVVVVNAAGSQSTDDRGRSVNVLNVTIGPQ